MYKIVLLFVTLISFIYFFLVYIVFAYFFTRSM